jgi:hypothetical protein
VREFNGATEGGEHPIAEEPLAMMIGTSACM